MSGASQYRFLPWSRRGLAASIPTEDNFAALPARAKVSAGVTVTNVGTHGIDLSLYGPGDVLGVDSRLIARVSPRAQSTNVETNYFPAIEFDPPEFPWLFTPARANAQGQLRPWLVLIVLDRARVEPPKADRMRPLPSVRLSAEVAALELPDLSESWAWAHTQLITDEDAERPLAEELTRSPDLNVSRLLCPRRLEANHHYFACLVPAFDVGVIRGLGGTPAPDRALGPAWSNPPGAVELPVYYHWEFATGPLGDFESLARKLEPFACPDSVGVAEMYIGDGNPVIPAIPPDQTAAKTLMDGALRAPSRGAGTLEDIDPAIQSGLAQALNAPARMLENGPTDATPVLGPPIYGQWHARKHEVDASAPRWLREANLDPRARVAAGLGAEVARIHQEDFMQKAWEQVGEILKANQRLNWGRLGLEASRCLFERHFLSQPADRLFMLAAPLHGRTRAGTTSMLGALYASSLPNASADPALRRLTSPQRPLLKAVARKLASEKRLAPAFTARGGRSELVPQLAKGVRDVEPARFVPDGVVASLTLDAVSVPASGLVDLTAQGLAVQIDAARVRAYQTEATAVKGRDFQASPPAIGVRKDLRVNGIVTRTEIDNLVALQLASAKPDAVVELSPAIDAMLQLAGKNPNAKALLVTSQADSRLKFDALDIDAKGNIVAQSTTGQKVTVGSLSTELLAGGLDKAQLVLSDLPLGTLDPSGSLKPLLSQGASGEIVLRDSAFESLRPLGGTVLSPGAVHAVVPRGPAAKPMAAMAAKPMAAKPMAAAAAKPMAAAAVKPSAAVRPSAATASSGATAAALNIAPAAAAAAPPGVANQNVLDTTPAAAAVAAAAEKLPFTTNTLAMPVRAIEVATRYEATLQAVLKEQDFGSAVDAGRFVAFDLASANATLLAKLDPSRSVPKRMLELVKVEGQLLSAAVRPGLTVLPRLERVMAAPDLPAASYKYLAGWEQERFVPGIGVVPQNSITLLETNPRFIQAFMLGLNYEMNRELLWREYPTDQRGTPFRHFWQWLDGQPDVAPIHQWSRASGLGEATRGAGQGGQLVMLVRGDLIRRYPHAVLLAWKASKDGTKLLDEPTAIKKPAFQGTLEPDVLFAGFDLVDTDLGKDGGWFFVVQEQPTEPRFGFDHPQAGSEQPSAVTTWANADWGHTGAVEGAYLRLQASPLWGKRIGNLTFATNAAHLASITLQQPMRVAVHDRHLVIAKKPE
jgi:hypothetical protein